VYDQIAQANQLVHLACWAHCRRDFNDALQALPKNARTVDQWGATIILSGLTTNILAGGEESKAA
jgi:hypothetical protein